MSTYPYIDEQVKTFADALDLSTFHARDELRKLHEAGMELTFPEPPPLPYYVRYGSSMAWVYRRADGKWVSKFSGEDRNRAAETDCDRRIIEAQS